MLKDATYEMAQAGKPSAFIAERLTAAYDLGVVTVRQVNRWLNERFNATRDETIANVFDDVKYLRQRRLGNERQGIEEFLDDDGGAVSNDHPHVRGFLPG